MTTDLALHATVRELCAAFVSAERDVRAAFAQIVAAEERLGAAFAMGEHYARIHDSACGSSYRGNFKDPDAGATRGSPSGRAARRAGTASTVPTKP